jgi:CRP-like cAMP-binding protein
MVEDRIRGATEMGTMDVEMEAFLAKNYLFQNMSEEQIEKILELMGDPINIESGATLIEEDEQAAHIYVIRSGSFEVLKREPDSEISHRIAVLGVGDSIGEVSLLDAGRRSASVRALEDSSLFVIPIERLEQLSRSEESIDARMKINLAYEMGRRLRNTNEATVKYLRDQLDEARTRAEMGKFMSKVLIGTCLYMFALGATTILSDLVPDTTMVSLPILCGFALGVYLTIRTSIYPVSAYGLTMNNWRHATKESLLFSIPVAFLIVFAKFLAVTFVPQMQDDAVLDFSRSTGLDLSMVLLFAAAYACFTPVQELVARSGLQSSFQMFLTGKYRIWSSIFLANLLFSATHLHVSVPMALTVFPLGLFWGWLYSRHGTIFGVCVSHALLGVFGLVIVGFDVY